MDKLLEFLSKLFKWSGEASWTGIVKGIVVIASLALMGLSGYLAYISYIPWYAVLIGLGVVVIFGLLFILLSKKSDTRTDEEKYDDWYHKMRQKEIEEAIENRNRRIETMPIIQERLRALSYINGPEKTGHAAIYEFHNGHSNPAGLGFQFAELTAEEFGIVQHTAIQTPHLQLPLGVLQIPHLLRAAKDNLWCGDKEALKEADPKLYMMISNYVCEWLAIKMIKTTTEIGILVYFSQKELSQEEIEYTIQGINDAALIIGERLDYREYKIK